MPLWMAPRSAFLSPVGAGAAIREADGAGAIGAAGAGGGAGAGGTGGGGAGLLDTGAEVLAAAD